MARSRIEERKIREAAGETPSAKGTKKKKKKAAKRKTATRTKRARDAPQRKRMVWCVFTANMKEEGRFPYDQRDKAEEKLEALRAKSKKLYFIQPVKELILEDGATAPVEAPPEPDDLDLPDEPASEEESEEESEIDDEEEDSEE